MIVLVALTGCTDHLRGRSIEPAPPLPLFEGFGDVITEGEILATTTLAADITSGMPVFLFWQDGGVAPDLTPAGGPRAEVWVDDGGWRSLALPEAFDMSAVPTLARHARAGTVGLVDASGTVWVHAAGTWSGLPLPPDVRGELWVWDVGRVGIATFSGAWVNTPSGWVEPIGSRRFEGFGPWDEDGATLVSMQSGLLCVRRIDDEGRADSGVCSETGEIAGVVAGHAVNGTADDFQLVAADRVYHVHDGLIERGDPAFGPLDAAPGEADVPMGDLYRTIGGVLGFFPRAAIDPRQLCATCDRESDLTCDCRAHRPIATMHRAGDLALVVTADGNDGRAVVQARVFDGRPLVDPFALACDDLDCDDDLVCAVELEEHVCAEGPVEEAPDQRARFVARVETYPPGVDLDVQVEVSPHADIESPPPDLVIAVDPSDAYTITLTSGTADVTPRSFEVFAGITRSVTDLGVIELAVGLPVGPPWFVGADEPLVAVDPAHGRMLVPGPSDVWSIIADDADGLLTLVPVMGTSTLGTLTRPAFSPDGAWAIVDGRWVDTSVPTAVASVPTGSDADAIFAAAAAVAVVRYAGPAGSNGQVVAWDGTDLVTRMTLPVPGGADALSADGRWLARSDTAGVSVYDTLSGLVVPGPYATGDQTARVRFTGERALVVAPGFDTVVSVLDPVGATSLQIGIGLDAALGAARVVVAHADGPVTWHDLAGPTGTVPGTSDSSWAAPAGPLLAVQDVEGLKLVDPDSSAVVATWAGVWHPGAHLADGSRMLMGEPSGEVRVLPDGGWERIETDLASVRFADGLHGVYSNPNVRIATYSPEGALLTELEHPGATLEPLFRDTWLGSARGAPCALFIGLDDTVCAR